MPHTFLEHSHYPRQRQDHLDVGIGFGGKPAELLHGALLVNLISFLHSDSPFSWKKNFPEAITPRGVRVATFYGLPGNFGRTSRRASEKPYHCRIAGVRAPSSGPDTSRSPSPD